MNKSQIAIQNAFDIFKRKIIQINYLQSITKSVYENSILELNRRIKVSEEHSQKIIHSKNFLIRNITLGQLEHCELNEFTLEEEMSLVYKLFNKQYQSFLVDAFEAYENYLLTVYSVLIKNHHEFSLKKFKPISFIKLIHKQIPQVNLVINIRNEQNNKLPSVNKTLFLLSLIEGLRHKIVHNQGMVIDKKEFIDKRMKEIGLYQNGNYPLDFAEDMNIYFGVNTLESLICLLEVYEDRNPNYFHRFHDRLGNLVGELISYTKFINQYLVNLA